MRSLVFDELKKEDVEKIELWLNENTVASGIKGLFWVKLDNSCLTSLQKEHEQCHPYKFAIELGKDFLRLEFLIRPDAGLRCHCVGYANQEQQMAIIAWAEKIADELNLST